MPMPIKDLVNAIGRPGACVFCTAPTSLLPLRVEAVELVALSVDGNCGPGIDSMGDHDGERCLLHE